MFEMFVAVGDYIRLIKFPCESCDNAFGFISVLSNTSVQISNISVEVLIISIQPEYFGWYLNDFGPNLEDIGSNL